MFWIWPGFSVFRFFGFSVQFFFFCLCPFYVLLVWHISDTFLGAALPLLHCNNILFYCMAKLSLLRVLCASTHRALEKKAVIKIEFLFLLASCKHKLWIIPTVEGNKRNSQPAGTTTRYKIENRSSIFFHIFDFSAFFFSMRARRFFSQLAAGATLSGSRWGQVLGNFRLLGNFAGKTFGV